MTNRDPNTSLPGAIDELIDRLDEARTAGRDDEVADHLAALDRATETFPKVRAAVDETVALVEDLRRLPESVEPRQDLWADIRQRTVDEAELAAPNRTAFESDGRNLGFRWMAAAALAAILLGGAFVMGQWSLRDGRNRDSSTSQATIAPARPPAAGGQQTVSTDRSRSPSVVSQAERDLAVAADSIRGLLAEHRSAFPPETLALIETNLATIETAIAEIETALDLAPDDSDLQKLLVAYRQRELGLLEHVTRTATRL